MSGPTHILKVEQLAKNFGGVTALAGVDLSVNEGEIHAIIGPNGAGKSTFFNTLTGLLKADAGRTYFAGQDITACKPETLARLGVSRTFQITSIFADLTPLQNVQIALFGYRGATWWMWNSARELDAVQAEGLLELVGLAAMTSEPAGTLSHGDQKRLELAVALAGKPRLLLLDEPTAGMTAQERLESIRLVRRLGQELDITVVFTEHDMDVVFEVATRISVLHQGRMLAEGSPEAVRNDKRVQQVYLGE